MYFGDLARDLQAEEHVAEPKDMLELNNWAVVGDHKSNAICDRLCSRLEQCGKTVRTTVFICPTKYSVCHLVVGRTGQPLCR